MKKKGSKGLSTIVITLIMIVLALVAVGAVWLVVSNLLKGQSEQTGTDKITFEAGITALSLDNSTNNVSVTVERKVGEGNLVGMKFYFYNETSTEVKTEHFTLSELAQKKFTFHLGMNISTLTKVSIIPLFAADNGKENLGNLEDTYDIKSGTSTGGGSSNEIPPCSPNSYTYSCSGSISIRLDNCGNYQNQTCTSSQICLTNATRCQTTSSCTPTTCSALGYTCGTHLNGTCSGTLNCGTCTTGSCIGGTCQTITSGLFPIGVWLQQPTDEVNGVSAGVLYKNAGVNTFVGLWRFPDESWAWGGYTLATLTMLKNLNLTAYAGGDSNATAWIRAHPEFNSTIVGYILGDEPDMFKVNGNPMDMPDAWKARGDSLLAEDPGRGMMTNFGKGFALDPWVGYDVNPGPTQLDDFTKYVSPNTVISSDYYGITDPWEGPNNHGIWTYGRAVTNTMRYAGTRPVWGVLEASAPFEDGVGLQTQMYITMPTSYIMPTAWNMIVHGARGITYFCHSFSNSAGVSYHASLIIPGMLDAMTQTNNMIQSYANVLLSPTVSGTTSNTTGVNVTTLTKNYGGATYIFAMGDGDQNNIHGQAVDATITVSGAGTRTVRVLNENNRTISMVNSRFTEHFDPYQLRIYYFQ